MVYGAVGAALVALVAGFFIRYSNIPLFVSIAFSATATGLIMAGWAKRRKLEDEVELPEAHVETAFDLDDLGEDETQKVAAAPEPAPEPELEETAELPVLKKKAAAPESSRRVRARVVVVPGRGRYHKTSCRFAKHPAAERITAAAARKRGLDACSVCKPG